MSDYTPKTILHIIDSLKTGGAEKLLVGYVNELKAYNNIIVTLTPGNDFEKEISNIEIIHLNHDRKIHVFQSLYRLRKVLIKHKPYIIHSHLYWSTIIARISSIGLNVRFLFSLHTIMSKDSLNNSRLLFLLEKFTYTKNQSLIAVSNAVLKDYDNVIGIKGKNHVLYNFISKSFFLSKVIRKERKVNQIIKLVAVGNIKPVKNYNFLLDVFKEIDNSKFSLDIFGIGDGLTALKDLVNESKLNITFKGSSNQLASVLPFYDVYLMPSLYEGFGIAPLEAMAVGLPVVLSDIDIFRELAIDEALFFNPENKIDLIEILNRIERNEIDLTYLSIKGVKRAKLISKKDSYLKQLNVIYLE